MRTPISLIVVLAACASAQAALPTKTSELDTQTQMNAVAEALQPVAQVEELVASYRLAHDDFPASNAEAGVKAPPQFASNTVKRIAIRPGGIIDVTLTAASGVDDGVVRFRPEYVPQSGGGDVHWTCASASYANIGDLTGGSCEHTTQP